jgi:hypothetical protein
MVRSHRITLCSALAAVALLAVACVGADIYARSRATHLLQDVRNVTLGRSTEADISLIVRKHGREAGDAVGDGMCAHAGGTAHSVRITGGYLPFIHQRIPFFQSWAANADFLVQDGLACFASYKLYVYSPNGGDIVLANQESYQNHSVSSEGNTYSVSAKRIRNFDDLTTRLSLDANSETRQRAFDFDLSCLIRLGGCRAACELMPSAWLDYQQKAKQEGWTLPADETGDSRCKKLAQPG